MNKYLTNVPFNESRSKQKKTSRKMDDDEKREDAGKTKNPGGHAGANCGESYKTIWKANMGK